MKNLDLKKTLQILGVYYSYNKTWKWREFQKSYTESRDCSENVEDEKFNPWRKNHNLRNLENF